MIDPLLLPLSEREKVKQRRFPETEASAHYLLGSYQEKGEKFPFLMKQKIPQELLLFSEENWKSPQIMTFPTVVFLSFFELTFLLFLFREKGRNHIVFSLFHVKRMKRSKKVCRDFLSSFHPF